ncbi:MAG: hypothetical protein WDN28_23720 [Chthoniobacter sp.]
MSKHMVSTELEIVRDVSERLTKAGIPFMLTGSMAMNVYAEPRMTRDVDIVLEVQSTDLQRLVSAFRPGYYLDEGAVERALRSESLFNVIHQEMGVQSRLHRAQRRTISIDGVQSPSARAHRRMRNLGGQQGRLDSFQTLLGK